MKFRLFTLHVLAWKLLKACCWECSLCCLPEWEVQMQAGVWWLSLRFLIKVTRGENSGHWWICLEKYCIYIFSNQNLVFPSVMDKGNKPVALTESMTLSPMKSQIFFIRVQLRPLFWNIIWAQSYLKLSKSELLKVKESTRFSVRPVFLKKKKKTKSQLKIVC